MKIILSVVQGNIFIQAAIYFTLSCHTLCPENVTSGVDDDSTEHHGWRLPVEYNDDSPRMERNNLEHLTNDWGPNMGQ